MAKLCLKISTKDENANYFLTSFVICKKRKDTIVELYIIDINDLVSKEQYTEWLNKVSSESQKRIRRFRFLEDAKRSLYGEILVRYLACQKLHIKNEDIKIERNLYGKPFLKGYPVFSYNISHAGKWIICVIADYPVGVDIELVKFINLDIAKRFFTKAEYEMILMETIDSQQQLFYQIWTAKESYIKYIGRGLSIPLNSFTIYKECSDIYKVDLDTSCIIKTINSFENYIVSICHTSLEEQQIEFRKIEMKEITL